VHVELIALIPSVVLGGILWYVLKAQARDRETYLAAITLAIKEGTREREQHAEIVAELTEKIQHPTVPHPRPAAVEGPSGPPPEPEPAFAKVGTITAGPGNDSITPGNDSGPQP
jgi:hypothetical protein